jgi:3-O-methylgallate 3,4-dioxygenase
MATITLGIGTSHTPMLSVPGTKWAELGERDRHNGELVFPPQGWVMSFDDAVTSHVPDHVRNRPCTTEVFVEQSQRCQQALDRLAETLAAAEPDITIVLTDDQEEWFFEDNMPALAVYWGDSAPLVPRKLRTDVDPETARMIRDGYGDVAMDVPVAGEFGRFLIDHLIDQEFDVAHFNEVHERYGGRVTYRYPKRTGELATTKVTEPRPMGLPHGVSFVIKRLFGNTPRPILPVFQNTCYPPNVPTPGRSFRLGRAIAAAVQAWDEDATVAVVASGGLSHFVVDEELDHLLLDALAGRDADALEKLPRHRMYSGTSEMLNWVAAAGALHDAPLAFALVDYVPVYRSEAGTGGGWGFGCWR